MLGLATFVSAEEKKELSSSQKAMKMLADVDPTICSSVMDKAPYLSVMPIALDKGNPIVFICDLSQHTENINKSGTVSLVTIKVDPKDVFNTSRVTFNGTLKKVDGKEFDRLSKIYVKRFPSSKQFINFGDFNFYRLETKSIHFIGGFGDIDWIDPKVFQKEASK